MIIRLETVTVRMDDMGERSAINVTFRGTPSSGDPSLIHRFSILPDGSADAILRDFDKLEETIVRHLEDLLGVI